MSFARTNLSERKNQKKIIRIKYNRKLCVCVISKQAKENQDKIFFLKEKKRIFCKKKTKTKNLSPWNCC